MLCSTVEPPAVCKVFRFLYVFTKTFSRSGFSGKLWEATAALVTLFTVWIHSNLVAFSEM